jgi:antitoxin YefM
VVIIQRRGGEDVAMITADELAGLLETAHLLRSPKNAKRLLSAIDRVRKESGTPQTIDDLRSEVGFE